MIEDNLKKLGIELPNAPEPVGAYVAFKKTGNLLFISGQLPFKNGTLPITGIVGDTVSIEDAIKMAELCALALLSQLKQACSNDLNRVIKVVKLGGFVASSKNFGDQPKIINGASYIMVHQSMVHHHI